MWGAPRSPTSPDDGPATSGLTGNLEVIRAAGPTGPRDFRDRWRNVQQSVVGTAAALPRVLRLVWDASPAITLGLFATSAIAGILPAAAAYTSKLLVNAVVQGIAIRDFHLANSESFPIGPWQTPTFSAVGAVIFLAVIQLVLFALTALLGTIRNIIQQLLQNAVTMRIQLMIMEKAASLDLSFFEDPASYDLLRRAQVDSINRPMTMISTAFNLVQTTITFATMIALLIAIGAPLALLALLSPIPAFIVDIGYGWRGYNITQLGSSLLRRMAYLASLVTTDRYAKEVKLFGLGGYFVGQYRLIAEAFNSSQRSQVARRYLFGFAWGNLSTLAMSLTYLYVALQAIVGRLTLGDLTMYTTAAQSLQGSIQGMLVSFSAMYENNLYLNNLSALTETRTAMTTPSPPVVLPKPVRGEITFENVSFAYPGAQKNALTDVAFTVKPSETLAVVGRNGAGKTTLFKLICRLYDPTGGRILLDGIDIRDFAPKELRAQIGAMFQDYVMYQATAAENIGLGHLPDLTDRKCIVRAARKAGADKLLAGLDEGYDTALGKWFDTGVNLSGGEWQKIALARGYMRDARILLLDEPTSALDAQSEYDLSERLRSLAKGRTAVCISHRFSTVRKAHRILLLEQGRLVEEGTHLELMRLDGRYARLFRMQAAAYTGEDPS